MHFIRAYAVAILLHSFYALDLARADASSVQLLPDDLLIPPNSQQRNPDDELSPADVIEDVRFLLYGLDAAYGGRWYVPHDNMRRAKAALEHFASAMPNEPWTVASLCDAIDTALLEIPDNHLVSFSTDGFCSPARIAARLPGQVGSNAGKDATRVWESLTFGAGDSSLPVLAVHRMASPNDPGWSGFLMKVESILAARPTAFVFDLRGTRGGADAMAKRTADLLFGQAFPYPVRALRRSQTAETIALWLNELADVSDADGIALRQRYLEMFDLAKQGHLATEDVLPFPPPPPLDSAKIYPGRVFVLTDRACVSSCEYFVEYLRQHPSVQVVGEATRGAIHFGNVGFIRLPRSRIDIQMPTQYREYWDGRWVETRGYLPEIIVAPGHDALEAAARLVGD